MAYNRWKNNKSSDKPAEKPVEEKTAQTEQSAEVQQTEKKSNKERLKEITDSIETGIKELFSSDKFKQYLQTMSRFHRYSVNNQMLIYMQKPNATHVAGFNKWRDQFGRNVKKGERGIKIIAPTPYKKKVEQEKLDPDTKLPLLDDTGKPIMEEKEIEIPMYRVVSVFDVSQTFGKPLPQLASDLTGNVQNYEAFLEAIKRSCAVPISFEPLANNLDGYFSLSEQRIAIREGMSEVQTVSALLHEIAHSKLHNKKQILGEKLEEVEIFGNAALFSNGRIDESKLPTGLYCYNLRGSDDDPGKISAIEHKVGVNHAGTIITAKPLNLGENNYLPINDGLNFLGGDKSVEQFLHEQNPEIEKMNRNTEEVQAESISFAVCAYYGIKTDDNSFGYIASWSDGKELSELKASLEVINKTSAKMIDDIDKNYAIIKKELGLEDKPELDEAMFDNGASYLHLQRTDDGWDYTIYDNPGLVVLDGGNIDEPELSLDEVKDGISAEYDLITPYGEPMSEKDAKKVLDDIADKAATLMRDDLPDPKISIMDMQSYGYNYEQMLPLTQDVAQKLFEMDAAVYRLYPDNTEGMVIDDDEIKNFEGIFGIEIPDWEAVKENYLKNAEMSVEDDYDMVDGIINNGDNIDRPTAAEPKSEQKDDKARNVGKSEKPSLIAKLNNPLPKQDRQQTKHKEMEM